MRTKTYGLKIIALFLACAACFFAGREALAQDASAPITVKINGKTIDFGGQEPQKINGYVMIPLRSVGENLGATIVFNPESKTIEASRRGSDVILKIGDSDAYVNHSRIILSQPPLVSGTVTLVPLRFVAQAFGAKVRWSAETNTVEIFSRSASPRGQREKNENAQESVSPASKTDAVSSASSLVTLVGAIGAIDARSKPMRITLLINGEKHRVELSPSCVILVQRGDAPSFQSNIWALRVGDFAKIQTAAQDGPAAGILVSFDEASGTAAQISAQADGSHTIRFESGRSVQLIPGAALSNGRSDISWRDIKPGDPVVIRLDQESHTGYALRIGHSFTSPKAGETAISKESPENDQASGAASAAPAAPAAPAQSGSPVIRSIRAAASGTLKAGDQASFSIHGSRGQTAVITIPDISASIPMAELAPGDYHAVYVVPAGLSAENASVYGSIMSADGRKASVKAGETISIQSKIPQIRVIEPLPEGVFASSHPVIAASLSEEGGAKIDPSSARVILDNRNVTASAHVTNRMISALAPFSLFPGLHRAYVSVCDAAGNRAALEWRFVVDPHCPLISSIAADAPLVDPVVKAGQTIHITLNAQPDGNAAFSILGVAYQQPMKESAPGVYVGEYTPSAGQASRQSAIIARFVSKNGETAAIALSRFIEIDAERPVAPVISYPRNGDEVGDAISIQGSASPGALVSVVIKYRSPGVADIYQVNGLSAAAEIQADSSGRWKTEALRLKSGGNYGTTKGTTYTATAVATDSNGAESFPASVAFKAK